MQIEHGSESVLSVHPLFVKRISSLFAARQIAFFNDCATIYCVCLCADRNVCVSAHQAIHIEIRNQDR